VKILTKIGKILYEVFAKHPQMKERFKKKIDKGLTASKMKEYVDMGQPCYLLFPDPTSFGCQGCDLKCKRATTTCQKLRKHSLSEIADKTQFYKRFETLLQPTIN